MGKIRDKIQQLRPRSEFERHDEAVRLIREYPNRDECVGYAHLGQRERFEKQLSAFTLKLRDTGKSSYPRRIAEWLAEREEGGGQALEDRVLPLYRPVHAGVMHSAVASALSTQTQLSDFSQRLAVPSSDHVFDGEDYTSRMNKAAYEMYLELATEGLELSDSEIPPYLKGVFVVRDTVVRP